MKTAGRSILIFGGTTEGRNAAEGLLAAGVPCTVSVATHYGEEVLTPHPLMTVHAGRLDRSGMAQLMREGSFSCVIDATHPHAQIVSGEIGAACRETGLPYLHLQREVLTGDSFDARENHSAQEDDTLVYVSDADQAGAFLSAVPGHILVTTGSKELVRFTKALGDPSRITARVLPTQESLRACAEAGLAGKQIFAMQGPFDVEMNCAQIHYAGASWLLTKETGAAGGFPEKTEAVRRCGIRAVVIRTPGENRAQTMNLEQTVAAALRYAGIDSAADTEHGGMGWMSARDGAAVGADIAIRDNIDDAAAADVMAGTKKKKLFLVGTGVGSAGALTKEAEEAVASAEVLFGAKKVLDNLTSVCEAASSKMTVPVYDSMKILRYLSELFHASSSSLCC